MIRLRAHAPGKVNVSLLLGPTRPDGRHELVTVLESVSLADELTLTTGPEIEADVVVCPGVDGDNLAAAALRALRAGGWPAPPVRIEIVKHLPVAAGMGGGSADAAATLRLAAHLEPAGTETIDTIAAELGADVPSQLAPGLVIGRGAGDEVTPLAPLPPHAWVIILPSESLSTAAVYAEADRLNLPRDPAALAARAAELEQALAQGRDLLPELIENDLAPATRSLLPTIDTAIAALREAGAAPAIVCGSGPTTAGIVWGPDAAAHANSIADRLHDAGWPVRRAVPVTARDGAPTSL